MGLNAIKSIKYEKNKMKTFFDDVPPNMGWSYLSDQIFEMPRDQKYMSVLKKY